jgi:hypothetical protein
MERELGWLYCAQVEAGAAKDELKRLRKEMLRLKNEWSSLRALYESAKVHLASYRGQR